ncbi:hypothetical protein BP6252_00580 [Coleophoma cylindrospora]|uniref:Fe2OG dioxygenase domain-containing protein n=1 Tax=Coleophoma cylindrospora TaxID=1849047 RepID=A0A3D8SS11_9HELO|nr:hypothetical protein BP6252_00580 [Coleophoma cylindrospora]
MTIQQEIEVQEEVFDPKIHLAYEAPKTRLTLSDLKIQGSATSTPIAATSPFPILSHEGILAYRRALFRRDVLHKCAFPAFPGTLILRNAAEHSTFIEDFWTHPETLRLVSDAAGVPLSIVMRTEIGHTNIQTSGRSLNEMIDSLSVEPDTTKIQLSDEEKAYDPLRSNSIIPWHYDSYPYVCVLMLSDTDGMVGGETYIKTGEGVPAKVEGPAIGHGVLLQGGEVQHLAARALGVKERISTITSYCAEVPGLYDSSFITNIRPYTDIKVLYKQWTSYRLEKMRYEIDRLQSEISQSPGGLDISAVETFVEDQINYLKRTSRQLIPLEQYDKLLEKFGKGELYNVSELWERAEKLPYFSECAISAHQWNWMPDSPLWYDLAHTQVEIRAGKELESQKGRFRWQKDRQFLMGDELLRQGLPELFLSWLDATGLYSMLVKMRTSL